MPTCLAALIINVPGAAVTGLPSIVRCIGSLIFSGHRQFSRMLIGAWLSVQVRFEVFGKFLDDGDGRHGCGVAQSAEGPAQHVLGKLANQRDVALLAAPAVETIE